MGAATEGPTTAAAAAAGVVEAPVVWLGPVASGGGGAALSAGAGPGSSALVVTAGLWRLLTEVLQSDHLLLFSQRGTVLPGQQREAAMEDHLDKFRDLAPYIPDLLKEVEWRRCGWLPY